MVAKVHDRMPVILGPEHFQWWLEPERFEPEFLNPCGAHIPPRKWIAAAYRGW